MSYFSKQTTNKAESQMNSELRGAHSVSLPWSAELLQILTRALDSDDPLPPECPRPRCSGGTYQTAFLERGVLLDQLVHVSHRLSDIGGVRQSLQQVLKLGLERARTHGGRSAADVGSMFGNVKSKKSSGYSFNIT